MQTRYLTDPAEAARMLREGAVVAVPTETVYGLAARFDRQPSVAKIFAAKGRPADNPLIIHLAEKNWLPRITDSPPPLATRLLDIFAPGPLTVTVPRGPLVDLGITAGLATVAVRIPDHPIVSQVLREVDVPLVAPSANRSGRPSPTTWQAVRDELDGRIDAVLMGQSTRVGIESTVVDCCSDPPRLLRAGGISYEALRAVVPELVIHDRFDPDTSSMPSPGLRHRHYSPRAQVIVIDRVERAVAESSAALIGLETHPLANNFAWTECFASVEEYARLLFSCLRKADGTGLERIYCQRVPQQGIGRGLMDRIERAAGKY